MNRHERDRITKSDLTIVKIGGNIIADPPTLRKLLDSFSLIEGPKILVHGGGKMATEVESKLGITSEKFEGRRITTAPSLDVMLMVYAGLVNKRIVAGLQAVNCNAIGLSGADGGTILAHKRPVGKVDFGFVGDIEQIGHNVIRDLLNAGLSPVFCALTHDGNGQLLNTNADTIASEIAISLSTHFKTNLYYCFEKKGVLSDINDENSVIRKINRETYNSLLAAKLISDGMLPKLHTCFKALESNVSRIFIGDEAMLDDKAEIYTEISL